MSEYIERHKVLAAIQSRKSPTRSQTQNEMLRTIRVDVNHIPAADVAPVVHGRWIEGAENFTCGNHNAECSVCHCNVSWSGCDEDYNYCPNCGARMDGE